MEQAKIGIHDPGGDRHHREPVQASRSRKTVDKRDIYLFKTEVLRALSDETRQGIIITLGKEGALCVSDLSAHFNVSRPTVSHHLHVLKEANMVSARKIGKEVYYSLNLRYIRRAMHGIVRVVESIGPESMLNPDTSHSQEEPSP